jgi:phospholipase/carboxylesterase
MPTLTRLVPFTHEVPVDLHRPDDGGDGSLVVVLHGMGMSAASFAETARALAPPAASVLVPQAPLAFELRGKDGVKQGNGWYVYDTSESDAFLASMRRTEEWLIRLVEFVTVDHGFDRARVSLVGFSQGGYLAGWVGIRHAPRFRRLVVAGGRIKHDVLEADVRRAAATPLRILGVHGEQDEGVSPAAARASVEAVAAWGVPAEFRTYPCGHGVLKDERCRADVRAFLAD